MLRKISIFLCLLFCLASVKSQEKSEREKSGLFGYVKSVRSETAGIIFKNEKVTEKKRVLDSIETFDISGRQLTNFVYTDNQEVLYGETNLYDSAGRLIEKTTEHSPNVYLCDKKTYVYEQSGRKVEEICHLNDRGEIGKTVYRYNSSGNLFEEERIPIKNVDGFFNRNSLKRFTYNEKSELTQVSEFEKVNNQWVSVNSGFGEHSRQIFSNEQSRISTNLIFDKENKLLFVEVTSKDEKGNEIETFRYLPDGFIKTANRYEYQYDKQGNIIKETTYKWITEDGKSFFKPAEVTYRKIEYYNPKEIKKIQPNSKTIIEAQVLQNTDKEEYLVYDAILAKKIEGGEIGNIVIKRFTSSRLLGVDSSLNIEAFTLSGQKSVVDQSAVDDYNKKNLRRNSALFAEFFSTKFKIILVNESEVKEIFALGCSEGWQKFYQKYPKSQGITTLSRVGFNAEKNKAIVYIGTQSQCLAGSGFLLVLQKDKDAWKIILEQMLWIS